jgi:hypothetical protein
MSVTVCIWYRPSSQTLDILERHLRVKLCVCVLQEVEPFLAQCHICGRRLVAIMSELRSAEGQSQMSRRQLHHQHRALTRALIDPDLQRLRREGKDTLTRLDERAQWLSTSEDVRLVSWRILFVVHTEPHRTLSVALVRDRGTAFCRRS